MGYEKTKVKIVTTLAGINGHMLEFSKDIEEWMMRAFNSKSGKKYGLDKNQIWKYNSHSTLWKDDYEGMQWEAEEYLREYNLKH